MSLWARFALIVPVLCSLCLYRLNFWLPSGCSGIGAHSHDRLFLVNNYMTEGRQKRFIKDAFKQYLSPAVIEESWPHPEH
jgi:adenylate cyclase